MGLISFGDVIGDFGGLVSLFTVDADFDQTGVAHGAEIDSSLEQGNRFRSLKPFPVRILLAPYGVQIEVLDHLAENYLGLNQLKLCLDEIRIVYRDAAAALGKAANIRLVALDLDAGSTGVRLRQNECHQRGSDNDEQKHRQNNSLPNSDDTPIIEEVKFRFLGRRYFQWIHRSKRNGG